MVGKSWDLVSASIEALGTRGEITFRGPVDADQADPAASLFLIAPDSAGPLEKPRCEREDGTSVPLLLCVPRQALESEDTFQGVDDFVAVPCTAAELAKRIVRLAERGRPLASRSLDDTSITVGDIALHPETYEVTVGGGDHTGLDGIPAPAFPHGEFRQSVPSGGASPQRLGRRLRGKLGRGGERSLRTVRNVGYGLERDHA